MSRQIDYTNGKIYKVVSNDYKMTYIGSTAQKRLCDRMNGHRKNYKYWKEGKSCKLSIYDIFDIYGVENCKIELIEEYACNSRNELQRKEGDFIKNTDCVNKIVAGRTDKEYREDNKEEIRIKKKEYKEKNKEEIRIKNKEYKEKNKEEIKIKNKEYKEKNKEEILAKHKEYKARNKEEILAKSKEYYEENKEQILEKNKIYREENKDKINEKIECSCGSVVVRKHLSRHNKSIKHQEWEKEHGK
jgi:hypothetical protein